MENLLFTATTDGCFQGREQPGNNADGSDDLVKFIAGKCFKKTQKQPSVLLWQSLSSWGADGGACPRRSTLKLTWERSSNKILTRSVSSRLLRSEERQTQSDRTQMAQTRKFCSLQPSAAANSSVGCKSLHSLSLWILMNTSASEPPLKQPLLYNGIESVFIQA